MVPYTEKMSEEKIVKNDAYNCTSRLYKVSHCYNNIINVMVKLYSSNTTKKKNGINNNETGYYVCVFYAPN